MSHFDSMVIHYDNENCLKSLLSRYILNNIVYIIYICKFVIVCLYLMDKHTAIL